MLSSAVGANISPTSLNMQLFLPFPNFRLTAACLDDRRLNKQIVEARQVYDILNNSPTCRATKAQRNHPIITTWQWLEKAPYHKLSAYIATLAEEFYIRTGNSHKSADGITQNPANISAEFPAAFHAAHRCALAAKQPTHYNTHFTIVAINPCINYLWYSPKLGWYTGSFSKRNVHIIEPTITAWLQDCVARNLK